MKKNLILVAMASMMMASCVQEESLENQDVLSSAPKEITFQTVVAKQSSRALINGSEYKPTDPSFGAWARYNPSGMGPGTMTFIENDRIKYLQDKNGLGYWGIDTVGGHENHHWPTVGSLTFFAYSPFYHQESLTDGETDSIPVVKDASKSTPRIGQWGISFPDYDVHTHQQTDLMVADVKIGQTANVTHGEGDNTSSYTGVPTLFRHKLALILEFKLSTSDDYDGATVLGGVDGTKWNQYAKGGDMRFFVKSIKLNNIETIGTYRGETYLTDSTKKADVWEAASTSQSKSYVWYKNDEGAEFGYDINKNLKISYIKNEDTYHKNPTIYFDGKSTKENQYHLLVLPQNFVDGKQTLEVEYFIKTYAPATDEERNPTSYEQAEQAWKTEIDNTTGKIKTITKTVDLFDVHPQGQKAWKMNQKIIYTLKFSTTEIRWAPHVVDWTATDYTIDF